MKSITGGDAKPVSPAHLEEELSKLWRRAAAEYHRPVLQACVLTLLVFTEDEQTGRDAVDTLRRLTLRNPCRAVLMIGEPGERCNEVESWVSLSCHISAHGRAQVCCEQISVRACGPAVEGLASVVLPLTVPELPVYLWLKTPEFAPPEYLDQLLRVSDRLVADSSRFSQPIESLQRLAKRVQQPRHKRSAALTDLNWARLTPIRELIAQCFDSKEMLPALNDLGEIRLEWQSASQEPPAQALLMAGWFAGRLGWKPVTRIAVDQKIGTLEFDCKGQPVRVEFLTKRADPKMPEASGLTAPMSIEMKTRSDPPVQFSVMILKDEKCVRARVERPGSPRVERKLCLSTANGADEAELLNLELRFPGQDRIYEEALAVIAQMMDI